jgi:hypothetical protein
MVYYGKPSQGCHICRARKISVSHYSSAMSAITDLSMIELDLFARNAGEPLEPAQVSR